MAAMLCWFCWLGFFVGFSPLFVFTNDTKDQGKKRKRKKGKHTPSEKNTHKKKKKKRVRRERERERERETGLFAPHTKTAKQ
jgi:hypothetical protein